MEIPGIADAMNDPHLREKAAEEAERLREALKEGVTVESKDTGVLRKELRVTVPAQVIADHLNHNFDEYLSDAIVPGFRKGRAPRRLVEKRFGPEIRDSLKTAIVGQSFFAACEKEKLDVLGDPVFRIESGDEVKLVDLGEALESLTMPENGDFEYRCEVELRPDFTLPELKGITIKAPTVEITDELVEEHLLRQRKIRGRYEPAPEGAPAAVDDMLIADVVLTCDGAEVKREENLQLGVRPTRLDGVPLPDLDKKLIGAKISEEVTAECTFPDDYERADLRGKKGEFCFKIHEIKRLAPVSIDDLVSAFGAQNEAELREFIRGDMETERDVLLHRAKREQVLDYLLTNTNFELPEHLSARQTDRAVMRAVIDLQQRGVPMPEIEAKIDELRTSARDQALRELKLLFVLDKVATELDVGVTDEEVNAEIARIARRYNRRFDRVRDDLQKEGLLSQLGQQIREDKCIAMLLKDAVVEEAAA